MINIFLSFAIGFGVLRWLWNVPKRTDAQRNFDRLKIFGYFLLLGYMNMLIAVTRGAIELNREAELASDLTEILVLARFPFTPEAIASLTGDSVLLLITGITFATLSMIDGYYFDDKVPGFGIRARARDIAKKNLKRERANSYKNLNRKIEDRFNRLHDGMQQRINAAVTWANIQDKVQADKDSYENFIGNLKVAQQSLIDIYRSNNMKERTTAAPDYFSKETILDYTKDFLKVHANIADDIVLEDKQKRKVHNELRKLIDSEYESSHAKLTVISDKAIQKLESC